AGLVPQRQHDGTDHRDQQHHTGDLEVINVPGVEHETERLGIADVIGNRRGNRLGDAGIDDPAATDQQQFGQEDPADHKTDRQIFQKALAQFGEIDIKHHDDKQEQRRDRAVIYEDENHPQEFGAHQHEQARRVDESEDQ